MVKTLHWLCGGVGVEGLAFSQAHTANLLSPCCSSLENMHYSSILFADRFSLALSPHHSAVSCPVCRSMNIPSRSVQTTAGQKGWPYRCDSLSGKSTHTAQVREGLRRSHFLLIRMQHLCPLSFSFKGRKGHRVKKGFRKRRELDWRQERKVSVIPGRGERSIPCWP